MGQHWIRIAVTMVPWLFSWAAFAHGDLSEYVQHEATLDAHGGYLDLTLQLTLFDELAEARRKEVDRDGDGKFSPEELTMIKKALQSEAEKKIVLYGNEKSIDLITRFDPEIVCAVPGVGGAHLRFDIRLHFFAQCPQVPEEGLSLEIKDGLFRDIPSMGSLRVKGDDQFKLTATEEPRKSPTDKEVPAALVFVAQLKNSK